MKGKTNIAELTWKYFWESSSFYSESSKGVNYTRYHMLFFLKPFYGDKVWVWKFSIFKFFCLSGIIPKIEISIRQLAHFMSLVSFYTPENIRKLKVFWRIQGGIERDQWHEMGNSFLWKFFFMHNYGFHENPYKRQK